MFVLVALLLLLVLLDGLLDEVVAWFEFVVPLPLVWFELDCWMDCVSDDGSGGAAPSPIPIPNPIPMPKPIPIPPPPINGKVALAAASC